MALICTSRFRGQGPNEQLHDYKVGQVVHGAPEVLAYLLRVSPAAFKEDAPDPAPAREDEVADNAMSTETATGLVVPDRRARGGRKRGK